MITRAEWGDFQRSESWKWWAGEMLEQQSTALGELASRMPSAADERRDYFLRGIIWASQAILNSEPEFVEEEDGEQDQS